MFSIYSHRIRGSDSKSQAAIEIWLRTFGPSRHYRGVTFLIGSGIRFPTVVAAHVLFTPQRKSAVAFVDRSALPLCRGPVAGPVNARLPSLDSTRVSRMTI